MVALRWSRTAVSRERSRGLLMESTRQHEFNMTKQKRHSRGEMKSSFIYSRYLLVTTTIVPEPASGMLSS